MNAHFRQGLRDASATLGRTWSIATAAACLCTLALAGVLEGQAVTTAEGARDAQLRLLAGVVFGLVLPLLAFGVSARLGGTLRELMTTSWARYGGDRQGYALGRQALAVLLTGVVAAVLGLLALGIGSATAQPGLELPFSFGNGLAVVWVGLLGSLAYTIAFATAHAYAGNTGRTVFLIADWLFGTGTSLLALPWPRSHLGALLGGHAPLGLGERESALCLVGIAIVATLLYVRRIPR
ncbi:MAG TPA: hypothetical protein VMG12_07785 [Polyangiaceae bacterium]|nr:hypothetical protein [Polyangiaceae bacterium]